jgi:hypothetical protein
MDISYSHDSLYPDKWDKPTIIYDNESKKSVNGTYKGQDAQVITNNIKNDKDRYIPPLHIITRDSGYSYNSNYGYLDDSNTNNINPDILDNYYYSSQRTNIIKDLNDKEGIEDNEVKRCGVYDTDKGIRESRRIIDSIKGSGRIIPSNKDTSQYINDINGKENKVVCVGCSCCGGVTDTAYDMPKQNIDSKKNPIVSDSVIPQLEPRYTSVIVPTNGYTWASTPMPNTDNYYVDLIKRPYSPILFSQNGKQLGYRYEQIKTGKIDENNKEPFIPSFNISPENKEQYNQINRYILIITIIVIVFIILKYHIYPFD